MEMIIHLDADVFETVDKGFKNVEGRVNDEKRQKLKIGDKLVFLKRPDEIEKIEAIVEELVYYKDFQEMIKDYSMKEIYLEDYSKDYYIELIKRFYSDEEINKYGVVAIKFKKI
jgi:ASC-1-like (ASCH) protein